MHCADQLQHVNFAARFKRQTACFRLGLLERLMTDLRLVAFAKWVEAHIPKPRGPVAHALIMHHCKFAGWLVVAGGLRTADQQNCELDMSDGHVWPRHLAVFISVQSDVDGLGDGEFHAGGLGLRACPDNFA